MNENYIGTDEITLKDLILKLKEFICELWNYKGVIIFITISLTFLFGYKAITRPKMYEGKIKFIIDGHSGGGGISGLLGQFGLGGRGGKTNPLQVIEVARSNKILEEVLFSNKDGEFFINQILRELNIVERGKESKFELLDFKFNQDSIELFDTLQIDVYNKVIGKIRGPENSSEKSFQNTTFDEETGVFTILTRTESEKISASLVRISYNVLKEFYENKTLSNLKQTRDLLKRKVDSLETEVKEKYIQIAKFDDRNRNLISFEKSAKRNIILGEIQALSAALAEAMKSYEIADYSLKDRQPQFMKIEESLPVLKPKKESLIKNLLIGFLTGIFISSIFIILRKIGRDALKN